MVSHTKNDKEVSQLATRVRMMSKEMGHVEIAEIIGVSRRTVARMLERGDLESRTVADVMKYRETKIREALVDETIEALKLQLVGAKNA